MACVYERDGVWVLRWKDGAGRWRERRSKAVTKTEANRLASDLERKAERQQLGLEPLPVAAPTTTFGDLLDWWWSEYGRRLKGKTIKGFVEKHLRSALGRLTLQEVTPGRLEELLNGKADTLKPRTLNALRGIVHRVFELAIRREKWNGVNPAKRVERRKVPKRLPVYLKVDEVPPTLAMLDPGWRPLFATAIYTGMRRGELLALRKSDVDLADNTIAVQRSGESDTTKGGHADLIPIADGLRPYLVAAFAASPSEIVFPDEKGVQRDPETKLDRVLRRALGRAGIVNGYTHVCRRKGCGHREPAADAGLRRCPACRMKLWPKAIPRHVRFHDLRHTTATLLLKSGVPLATVQRILRHTDPAITSEIYGHLDVEDMRAGVNRLAFPHVGALPEDGSFAAPVPRNPVKEKNEAPGGSKIPSPSGGLAWSGRQDLNLRPLGPESGPGSSDGFAPERRGSQPMDMTWDFVVDSVDRFSLNGLHVTPFAAPVPRPRTCFTAPLVLPERLLSVGEVATKLSLSRATVYKLVGSGALPHIRIGNAARVRTDDLAHYLSRR